MEQGVFSQTLILWDSRAHTTPLFQQTHLSFSLRLADFSKLVLDPTALLSHSVWPPSESAAGHALTFICSPAATSIHFLEHKKTNPVITDRSEWNVMGVFLNTKNYGAMKSPGETCLSVNQTWHYPKTSQRAEVRQLSEVTPLTWKQVLCSVSIRAERGTKQLAFN